MLSVPVTNSQNTVQKLNGAGTNTARGTICRNYELFYPKNSHTSLNHKTHEGSNAGENSTQAEDMIHFSSRAIFQAPLLREMSPGEEQCFALEDKL
jgi:hypothetical protein